MELLDRVRRTVRAHALAAPGTRVLVALSGGSDSVALTHLMLALHHARDLQVVGLAHFNHRLRPAADDDERFCARLAERLALPLQIDAEDVGARARRERRSIEDAARAARHAFLDRARVHFGADVIALGHTRDDQAETFLLRLLRGAGSRGLAGMHPRRGYLIRPLLDCSRADLRAYLAERQLPFVDDETNDDVSVPRNRVRVELLPLLRDRFNPAIVETLAAEAALARDEWLWMDAVAGELAGAICRRSGRQWHLDLTRLNAAPPALARHVLWQALIAAADRRPVSVQHVEAALALARDGGGPVDGPGQRIERIGSSLVLTARPSGARGRPARAVPNLFRFPLSIPGEVRSDDLGWELTAEPGTWVPDCATLRNGPTVMVQLCRDTSLTVRCRRPGDRFAPAGLAGRKKLQDYFVDRKVARASRDRIPIVVDADDRIVWVAGHDIDREFAVTDPAQAVLILRLKLLGGSA